MKKKVYIIVHPNSNSHNISSEKEYFAHIKNLTKLMKSRVFSILILDSRRRDFYFTESGKKVNIAPLKDLHAKLKKTSPFPVLLDAYSWNTILRGFVLAEYSSVKDLKPRLLVSLPIPKKFVLKKRAYVDPRNGDRKRPWPTAVAQNICIDHSFDPKKHTIFITGVEFAACVRQYALAFRKLGYNVHVDLEFTDFRNKPEDKQAFKEMSKKGIGFKVS